MESTNSDNYKLVNNEIDLLKGTKLLETTRGNVSVSGVSLISVILSYFLELNVNISVRSLQEAANTVTENAWYIKSVFHVTIKLGSISPFRLKKSSV
jgi:hypothetical protein